MILKRLKIADSAVLLLREMLKAPIVTSQMRERANQLEADLHESDNAGGTVGEYDNNGDDIGNHKRVKAAEAAVQAACRARGDGDDDVTEDSIQDLLADLGHLCDDAGVDFEKSILWALRRWNEER
jgi:predicted HD phosphohydrolase